MTQAAAWTDLEHTMLRETLQTHTQSRGVDSVCVGDVQSRPICRATEGVSGGQGLEEGTGRRLLGPSPFWGDENVLELDVADSCRTP